MTKAKYGERWIVLMLNKKERILVKELLGRVLSSKGAKEVLRKKLGKEYVEVALRLLRTVSGGKT